MSLASMHTDERYPLSYATDPVYRAHVDAVAAAAPPLTEDQRARLAHLFTAGRRRVEARRAA